MTNYEDDPRFNRDEEQKRLEAILGKKGKTLQDVALEVYGRDDEYLRERVRKMLVMKRD